MQQPPSDKGKRLKIYYMTQVAVKPPTFVIFVNDKELMPLQSFLRDLLMSNKMSLNNMQGLDAAQAEAKMQLSQTLKYSAIIVSTVPVLCIYPFIQKYFVKGVMIGSVKG